MRKHRWCRERVGVRAARTVPEGVGRDGAVVGVMLHVQANEGLRATTDVSTARPKSVQPPSVSRSIGCHRTTLSCPDTRGHTLVEGGRHMQKRKEKDSRKAAARREKYLRHAEREAEGPAAPEVHPAGEQTEVR